MRRALILPLLRRMLPVQEKGPSRFADDDWRREHACRVVASALALVLGASPMAAQSRPDSVRATQHKSPTPIWGSVGLGFGSASQGPLAGRAAASLAINSILLVTVSATTVAGP